MMTLVRALPVLCIGLAACGLRTPIGAQDPGEPNGQRRSRPQLDAQPGVESDSRRCAPGDRATCDCANGLHGSQVCLPSLAYGECVCGTDALTRVRKGVIGDWLGSAIPPWADPYQVRFTFDGSSHYSAHSSGSDFTAMYFGRDDESPDKRYSIDDIGDDGYATGTIDIDFGFGDTVRDKLEGLTLSDDLSHLKFYFTHSGQYGPFGYDLQRVLP